MRTIGVGERRARLARRHRLVPNGRADDVVEAASSMVCLHGTDPASVYLSAWARVTNMSTHDMNRALYTDRSLVKHLAMRRTLFVFPRDTLADAQAGASNRVADRERRRLIQEVETAGLHRNGARWLDQASKRVLAALADGREAGSTELRAEIPQLEGSIAYGEGKSWSGPVPIGPRVLTTLSAGGQIVRASNDGAWTASRPRWTSMESWLGQPLETRSDPDGVAGLVARWLRAFGPGTATDIKWWLGSTLGAVRNALATVGAVEVDLDGAVGYVLGDDTDMAEPVDPWAALLPPLDPTTMGWFDRDWYLGPHKPHLFDTRGNAGPTVWCDGRIVGGWRQDQGGDVVLQLLDDVGSDARSLIEFEAQRLSDWFGGVRVAPRFPSPLSRR